MSANKRRGEMKKYIILVAIIVIIICVAIILIKKCLIKSNPETDMSTTMITAGISLIVAAFPGTKEMLLSFIAGMADKNVTYETDSASHRGMIMTERY